MGKNPLSHGLASQALASLSMLKDCIERCPEAEWNESHGDYPFSQVVFHTLFDWDYNLCDDPAELREQDFHKKYKVIFADYEELKDGIHQHLYDLNFINLYYEHCRNKISLTLETKADADLLIPNTDVYRNMTKLERSINLIRHTQHHAAQLGLRLQFVTGKEMNWVSRGYKNDPT